MRIHISTPQVDVTINNSKGEQVFRFSATDYNVALNIAGIIAEAGSLAQMVDSIDGPTRPGINISDILMEAAREAEARRAAQAVEPDPTAPDANGWRAHRRLWVPESAPVTAGLHERVDIRLRNGDEHLGTKPNNWLWSVDPDNPEPGDIVAWRPA